MSQFDFKHKHPKLDRIDQIGRPCARTLSTRRLKRIWSIATKWKKKTNQTFFCAKFVGRGVFKAELNNFFTKELAEDGYSGVEVRVTPTRTEIIILATKTQQVLGEKGRRIRELTSVVQKRFNFDDDTVEVKCPTPFWSDPVRQSNKNFFSCL